VQSITTRLLRGFGGLGGFLGFFFLGCCWVVVDWEVEEEEDDGSEDDDS
jgi:hypothetical protein